MNWIRWENEGQVEYDNLDCIKSIEIDPEGFGGLDPVKGRCVRIFYHDNSPMTFTPQTDGKMKPEVFLELFGNEAERFLTAFENHLLLFNGIDTFREVKQQ